MKQIIIVVALLFGSCLEAQAADYKVQTRYSIPGSVGRRIYVSHSVRVNVPNADTGVPVGTIEDTPGVHGIAVRQSSSMVLPAQKGPDEYVAHDSVVTQSSAKTMAFDKKTEKIFLPAATVVTTSAADASQKPKKTIADGTFFVLVVGK